VKSPVAGSTCDCDDAAEASAGSYRHDGHEVVIQPLISQDGAPCKGQLVLVPALRHAEAVLDAETDFTPVKDQLLALSRSGWAAWAVVPLGRLGEAHLTFLGATEFVQGWWPYESEARPRVGFTEPQVP
jgi:hypothetical protein